MGDAVQSGNLGGFRFGQDVHGVVHANLETSRMLVATATEALGDQGIVTAKAGMGAMAIAVAIAMAMAMRPGKGFQTSPRLYKPKSPVEN